MPDTVTTPVLALTAEDRARAGELLLSAPISRAGIGVEGMFAEINGRQGIRACITNYRATSEDIDLLVDRLRDLAGSAR